ncbi:TPA: ead/Ea22-like family protein [Citrobacter freundii]|nr:ead/Ea22-like family protein [Citrobacter freundii]HEE9925100.1 ead/Ea22-like family protein [Citrobacter freundii]
MTALNKQALREAAENATAGQWVVELGDEVYAVDGDDSEQIAIVFSDNGRSDAAFIAAASPVAVLSLLDENLQLQRDKDSLEAVAIAMRDDMRDAREKLEAAEKRIAELEARTITVKFEPIPMEELGNRRDGKKHPYMFWAGYNSAVVHCESVLHQACDAAGIGVKGE